MPLHPPFSATGVLCYAVSTLTLLFIAFPYYGFMLLYIIYNAMQILNYKIYADTLLHTKIALY